nr:immunoglobulin heavy chain junction region [Mus musculus]MBK4195308.1 immunoglobulin heavy chain junction region [Mus musculus]
CAGSNYWFAYW